MAFDRAVSCPVFASQALMVLRKRARRGGRPAARRAPHPDTVAFDRINSARGGIRLARRVENCGRDHELCDSAQKSAALVFDLDRPVKLWYELTLIARANPGGQPQRPADQILQLALPELIIICDEVLRASVASSFALSQPGSSRRRRAPHGRPPPSRCAGRCRK